MYLILRAWHAASPPRNQCGKAAPDPKLVPSASSFVCLQAHGAACIRPRRTCATQRSIRRLPPFFLQAQALIPGLMQVACTLLPHAQVADTAAVMSKPVLLADSLHRLPHHHRHLKTVPHSVLPDTKPVSHNDVGRCRG